MSSKRKIIFSIATLAVLVAAAWGMREFVWARTTSASNACINNLRQIDGAVQQWALDRNASTNDVPTWADLVGANRYISEMPVCPQGGTYSLGRVADRPRCSIGGPGHLLP